MEWSGSGEMERNGVRDGVQRENVMSTYALWVCVMCSDWASGALEVFRV